MTQNYSEGLFLEKKSQFKNPPIKKQNYRRTRPTKKRNELPITILYTNGNKSQSSKKHIYYLFIITTNVFWNF